MIEIHAKHRIGSAGPRVLPVMLSQPGNRPGEKPSRRTVTRSELGIHAAENSMRFSLRILQWMPRLYFFQPRSREKVRIQPSLLRRSTSVDSFENCNKKQ